MIKRGFEMNKETKGEKEFIQIFQKLASNIQLKIDEIDQLNKFLEELRSSEMFDDEDRKVLENHIKNEEQQLVTMQEDYKKKKDIYERIYVRLRSMLDSREATLEEFQNKTGILKKNKDLYEHFVGKQKDLVRIYQDAQGRIH